MQSNENDENKWDKIFSRHDLIIWRKKLIEKDVEQQPEQPVAQSCIWEYKVFGRLYDVSAIDFFRTQIDINYRSKWDHLVIKLQVMSTDKKFKNQTSELVQWIMKYPFPMNSREYIFVRRYCVEPEKRLLILVSQSIPNPNVNFVDDNDEDECTEAIMKHGGNIEKARRSNHQCQEKVHRTKGAYEQPHQQAPYVRVNKYKSNMII